MRAELLLSTGLSAAMIDWALESTLGTATQDALRKLAAERDLALHERAFAVAPRLVCVILAGNVFTAAVRAVFTPLLAGIPVLVKAANDDAIFPEALQRVFAEVDPELASAFEVVRFKGGTEALERPMLEAAEVVSVYGGDETIESIRARTPASTEVIGHGHGLGFGYAAASVLGPEHLHATAQAFALDIAAYDQRGCMSPHAIFIEASAGAGTAFSHALSDALQSVSARLPRGTIELESQALIASWQQTSASLGDVITTSDSVVSYDGKGTLRISPGYRHVQVIECEGPAEFARRVMHLGAYIKCVGVAGEVQSLEEVAVALLQPAAPRICRAGTMQMPRFDAIADGRLASFAFRKFRELDWEPTIV